MTCDSMPYAVPRAVLPIEDAADAALEARLVAMLSASPVSPAAAPIAEVAIEDAVDTAEDATDAALYATELAV